MTDSTVGNDGTQEDGSQNPGGEADEQQGEQNKAGDKSDKTADDDKGKGDDDAHPTEEEWPEAARKELARVRKEAAAKRVALKEAQDQLSKAKTPEEFEAAKTELQNKIESLEYEVTKAKVLRAHNIPEEYEDLLDGVAADKLEEKAKKLAALANTQNLGDEDDLDDLLGGLTPRSGGSSLDSVDALYNAIPR